MFKIPKHVMPREKLIEYGVKSLSNQELLAILIRTGNKDVGVMDVSVEILELIDNVSDLSKLSLNELLSIKGIGTSKAVSILAAIELGQRINNFKKEHIVFDAPEKIFEYFSPRMKGLDQEHLYGIYFDSKGKVSGIKELTIGTVNQTLIDHKLIFKWAYKYQSQSFILVHNHPTGDSYPSLADIKLTQELMRKCRVMDFMFLDHVIIGDDYFSMRRDLKTYKIFI